MGKRSSFERIPRDFYPTLAAAVPPLIPHLRGVRTFAEPCSGDGALVRHLEFKPIAAIKRLFPGPEVLDVRPGDPAKGDGDIS
jgi:hypothetical protein